MGELLVVGRRTSAALAAAIGFAVTLAPGTASAHTLRPGEATGLHVLKVTTSSFTVGFNRAPHAKRYRLFASTVRSNLFVANIHNAERSTTSSLPRVSIGGLTQLTAPYYYRVESLNGTRWKFSGTIGEVGLRPPAPSNVRAMSNHTKTYVSWTPTTATATGYTVEQATNPSMTAHRKVYKVRGDANQFTPPSVNKGKTYYFRVRAVNQSTPSAATPAAAAVVRTARQPVRVMTYNVKEARFDGVSEGGTHVAPWSSKRKAAAARLIHQASPDVIGIQEAASPVGGHRQNAPRQVDTLRKALGGSYRLARTEIPPKQPGSRRTGNYILYKKSAYRAVGRGGHWSIGDNHTAAHQILRNRHSGAKVLFVNAHLSTPRGRTWDIVRKQETQRLVQLGGTLASRRGVPVVYVGDFNSNPSKDHAFNAPSMVMKSHHIADSFGVAQHRARANYNTANHYMRRPPHSGARIDYVYAPAGVGVRSWRLVMRLRHGDFVGTIPSDHNPVVSELTIPYS
jgi:endonuclease/exonuclease/phosphatase family metal-dependent hydrolase